MTEFSVHSIDGIGQVRPGDDLVDLIAQNTTLSDGDIVVVTSKIVSKAEGRIRPASEKESAFAEETVRVVAERGQTRIVENRVGVVAAAAGIDSSNTDDGTILLLPLDPDASAQTICAGLRDRTGHRIGVLLSDTVGRPWRLGQTDIAIGASGVQIFEDLRGHLDANGRPMVVTMPCVADQICAATELVRRKSAAIPVAVVRGLGHLVGNLDLPGARSINRPLDEDMFSQGSAEAWRDGFTAGKAASHNLS